MSSLAEMRSEVAEAVTGVGTPPLIGYAYPPASPITPCAIVETDEVDFVGEDASFRRGGEGWKLAVVILIAANDNESAEQQRDAFFDRSSSDLKDAIEAIDKHRYTVAGADRWGEYGPYDGGVFYAGLRLNVQVLN